MTSFGELRQRLLHPYYVLHLVYGVVYVVVRINQLIKGQTISLEASFCSLSLFVSIRSLTTLFLFQETEPKTFLILIGVSIWKCFMAATAEELSSVIILYSKFFTAYSLFWRFGFWYSCLYAIGWIGNIFHGYTGVYAVHLLIAAIIVLSSVFPQPWYRGPTKIYELNEAAFRDKVLLTTAKSKPTSLSASSSTSTSTMPISEIKGPRITEIDEKTEEIKEKKETNLDAKYWIVMLYANWSVACLNFEAVLAKLSIQYDIPHLKFGNKCTHLLRT